MPVLFNVSKCTLPVYDNVCFRLTSELGVFYVTAQPVWQIVNGQAVNPYAEIAKNAKSVLSVRDSQEATTQPNPFDLSESGQFIINNVAHTNISMPHGVVPSGGTTPQNMTQAQFDAQAIGAALVIKSRTRPLLLHCSTGDRASAVFACFMYAYCGYNNDEALAFATQQLALQNEVFKGYVKAFHYKG